MKRLEYAAVHHLTEAQRQAVLQLAEQGFLQFGFDIFGADGEDETEMALASVPYGWVRRRTMAPRTQVAGECPAAIRIYSLSEKGRKAVDEWTGWAVSPFKLESPRRGETT